MGMDTVSRVSKEQHIASPSQGRETDANESGFIDPTIIGWDCSPSLGSVKNNIYLTLTKHACLVPTRMDL